MHGDATAGTVTQGGVSVTVSAWTALLAGSVPLPERRHIRLFAKSKPGNAVALAYSQRNSDGTFTAPTSSVEDKTIYPGGTRWVEPVSDKVQVYGRLIKKAGTTENSARVVVTEYA